MSYYIILPLLAFSFSFILGLVVLWQNHRKSVHQMFSLFLFGMSLWGLCIFLMRNSPDVAHALPWQRTVLPISILTTLVFLHFTYSYTKRKPRRGLRLATCLLSLAIVAVSPTSLLVSSIDVDSYGYFPVTGPLFYPAVLCLYLFVALGLVNLFKAYRASTSYEERNRYLYIIIGLVLCMLGGIADAGSFFGLPLISGSIIGNILFSLLATWAMLRYHLLDIQIVMRKSIAYALASAAVALPYVGVIFLFSRVFKNQAILPWVYLGFLIILALALYPLLARMQRLVDRWFYRERYDYLKALEQFSREAQSIMNLRELGSTMLQLVSGALRISCACLLLPSKGKGGLIMLSSIGLEGPPSGIVLGDSSPLVKWLEHHGCILSSEQLSIVPQLQSCSLKEKNRLEEIGAKLYVPIRTRQKRLSGILLLGQKISEQPYSNEDRQMLLTMGSQMAMALENAQLYGDVLQAREDLETWLESMTDCVMIMNSDSTIQFANRAAVQKFGCRVGEKCWEATGKDTACPSCPMQIYIGGNRNGLQFRENIGDGVYDIAAAPLLSPDGSLCIIEVLRDITERKQVEDERQKLKKLESVGILAGGIAHDFNNLLTGIMGNISLAKRYVEPKGKAFERLDEAEKASVRARDLTQQLLTFATGGLPVKKLASVAELIKESAAFSLSGSGVRPEFSLPDDLQMAEIDEGQMSQVIRNIIINADEAMPNGGIINIRAKNRVIKKAEALPLPNGNYIEISIEDHGVGISKEHLPRIFDPYFTTKKKGSGLGLATVYSIAKNHGGHITVQSTQNVGTTFHIYLPASEKPAPIKEKEALKEAPIHGKGRILVMDDEEVIRELLSQELTDVGYTVGLTADGAEAIEQYTKAKESGQPFDAVIMDLTIPGGMGGKEAIKHLLELDSTAKVIVSSGYATDPILADYEKYGFSGVVAKPYNVTQIEKTLHDLLRKKK